MLAKNADYNEFSTKKFDLFVALLKNKPLRICLWTVISCVRFFLTNCNRGYNHINMQSKNVDLFIWVLLSGIVKIGNHS